MSHCLYKYFYLLPTTERSSKHIDELLATAGVPKGPVENKPGDTSILRVIEAYCAGGKGAANIRKSNGYIIAKYMCKDATGETLIVPTQLLVAFNHLRVFK